MYVDLPFWLALVFMLGGLWLLVWSANLFVDGAEALARSFGVSPFIIGMVVIGFGTSAPELAVSAISAGTGHSNLSLGNAYGSNIFNIAAILGTAAMIHPLSVKPLAAFVASPLLAGIALQSCLLVCAGGGFSRLDGIIQLATFAVLLPLYCWLDKKSKSANVSANCVPAAKRQHYWVALFGGLALLVASSHLLVWGAVSAARYARSRTCHPTFSREICRLWFSCRCPLAFSGSTTGNHLALGGLHALKVLPGYWHSWAMLPC